MTKHKKEKKLEAIQAVETGESIGGVARRYGIERRELSHLWKIYQKHGPEGLANRCYNWTVTQKYEVLKYMHENQLSCRETGIKFGIVTSSTVQRWENLYLEHGIDGLENKKKGRKPRSVKPKPPKTREEELLGRIEDLEIENEYLKKLNALVAEREKREKGIK